MKLCSSFVHWGHCVCLAREGKFSQKFKYYSKIFCAWFANIIMTERKRSHFSCNSFRFRAVQKIKKWGKCRHKSLIIITPLLDRLQKRESYRANKRFYPVLTNLGDPGNIFYPTWGTYIHNKQFSKCQNIVYWTFERKTVLTFPCFWDDHYSK